MLSFLLYTCNTYFSIQNYKYVVFISYEVVYNYVITTRSTNAKPHEIESTTLTLPHRPNAEVDTSTTLKQSAESAASAALQASGGS